MKIYLNFFKDLDPGVTIMVDPQEDLLDQDQIGTLKVQN